MSKNKLAKFAEMLTFPNVIQCGAKDLGTEHDAGYIKGHWHDSFFHNDNPIVLELGCGRGEYTVGLSQLYPDKNFIGVDIKGARMWAGAKQATEQQIANAGFLRTNIEMLAHFFAPNEVDELWLTFPDPQMKKATKRLTSSFFLQRYQEFMRDGGILHLKTDSNFLYEYTLAMAAANHYEVLFSTADLYASDFADRVRSLKTHYEHQWLERGLTIKYLQIRVNHHTSFVEPDVEIEKDTYRSYGRNYTTPKQ